MSRPALLDNSHLLITRTRPFVLIALARLGDIERAEQTLARDALGDPAAAGRALERALDIAEPDLMLFPFLIHPVPGLLERHAQHRTNVSTNTVKTHMHKLYAKLGTHRRAEAVERARSLGLLAPSAHRP